ncbi:unnamed protein product [Pieris brassicae]|uniref:Uncharacterized protein n=1 Tax=Pieris brassicae TaxID=7116 RepID=A0A9P0TNQ5_PIEBR|nr:unnamed protein product [Pieris brassicae]
MFSDNRTTIKKDVFTLLTLTQHPYFLLRCSPLVEVCASTAALQCASNPLTDIFTYDSINSLKVIVF